MGGRKEGEVSVIIYRGIGEKINEDEVLEERVTKGGKYLRER